MALVTGGGNAEEIRLAQAFADQAARALQNSRLVDELKSRQAYLEALVAVSRQLTAIHTVDALLGKIAEACRRLIETDAVWLFLVEGNELVLKGTWGDAQAAMPARRVKIGEGLVGIVASTGEPLIVPNVAEDARLRLREREAVQHLGRHAWLGVPVKVGEQLTGVLSTLTRREGVLTPDDVATLTAFASQAAIALDNARLYEEIRSAQDFLQSIADTSADAIVTTDVLGRITDFSSGAEEIFGYRVEEVLGRPIFGFYRSGAEEARAVMRRLRAEDRIRNYETAFQTKDGRWVEASASFSLLRDASGAITGTVMFVRDVTERRRAEESLRQSEKLAVMGSLLAGVAHELNNPLFVVLAQSVLLTGGDQARLVERAAKIRKAAEQCVRVVRNFLALARQHPAERQRVALGQVAREAVELLAYPLRVDGIEVKLDVAGDVPLLWADPYELQQVLVNLITNAHQAMRQTAPPRRLTLSTRFDPSRERVCLEVADTGPGIPPEIRTRVFEPFFTTKPVGQGTGLGLSLCRGIVEAHGGTMTVENAPAEGAVFRIELPVKPVPSPGPGASATAAVKPVRDKVILVVDDEPDVADVLVDFLSLDGHRVEIAGSGAVALDKLQHGTYDLILSDVKMPDLDGLGLYRALERLGHPLLQRVIFVTGDVLGAGTREFLERTGALCLSKPFMLDEVRRVLAGALRRA